MRVHMTGGGRNDDTDSNLRGTSERSLCRRDRSLPTPLSETAVYVLGRLHHETSRILHDH